jgi:hypothetical protein
MLQNAVQTRYRASIIHTNSAPVIEKALETLKPDQQHRPVLVKADVVETVKGRNLFDRLKALGSSK